MHIYFTFILFILGLVIASFLNALLYRVDNGYKYPDILLRGSHCEKCNKQLKVYELIPVISFLIFRGRCNKCGYRVPIYYPVSELFLGISFGSIYYYSLSPTLYIVILFFFSFSYFDRLYKSIPSVLIDTFLICSVIYFTITVYIAKSIPPNALIVGLILSLLILIVGKVFKKPFGLGDILVLLGASILMSIPMYIAFIYIFLILSTVYSLLLIAFKKATFKSALPLLPFMYISMSLLFLFYTAITDLIYTVYPF